MKRFEGKVVVVTGSGQGIGRGIALYFARNGAAIVTNNRKPLDMKKVRASYTDLPEAEQEKLIAMRGDARRAGRPSPATRTSAGRTTRSA